MFVSEDKHQEIEHKLPNFGNRTDGSPESKKIIFFFLGMVDTSLVERRVRKLDRVSQC